MIVTSTYQRKSFQVEAVQVTEENLKELAEWCDGQVKIETSGPHGGLGDPFIVVLVGRVNGRPKHLRAKVGDWITHVDGGFRVHRDKSFRELFKPSTLRYEEVHQVVVNAMRQQDAATWNGESSRGMDQVADKATRNILALL